MTLNGHPSGEPLPGSWLNRVVVEQTLLELIDDFEADGHNWENTDIPGYFEALSALLMSIENSYANRNEAVPDDPWLVIADALRGARYYE